jgi:membrane dipeptidase
MINVKTKRSRRWVIGAGLGAVGGIAATAWWRSGNRPYVPSIDIAPGRRVLAAYPAVDIHSHPGRTFLAGVDIDSLVLSNMSSGFEADRLADMRSGQVTASLFAIVADVKVLGISATSGIVINREFEPGEAFADFERQLDRFLALRDAGDIAFANSADEVRAAHRDRQSVVVLASEGADFVEDKLERLGNAYAAGLRSVTLVHYRPSEFGDNQTSTPVHGGLSAPGADVIREMNRLGMLIDMAHASFDTVRNAVEISSAPMILSHSHLVSDVPNARLLTPEHALLITNSGGVIGSWPAGVTSKTLSDFVDETFRLIDLVGIDHVSIGTDLDANYKPVLTDYVQFPEFVSMLLARGLSDEEAGKVAGENFLRVFDAASSAAGS